MTGPALHSFLVTLAWLFPMAALMFTGCHELDLTDDPVTDPGEESINAEGWNHQ